jgi:hypothetical protein
MREVLRGFACAASGASIRASNAAICAAWATMSSA